jgi:thioredoxin-dependent peroxiredoxin
MAKVNFKGQPVTTVGELPKVGDPAPSWILVGNDLSEKKPSDFEAKRKILNIFPSLDTGVCAASVREFNQRASQMSDLVVLHISRDLPFAQGRFCKAEPITHSHTLSAFRSTFPQDYGVEIADGPLRGLLARAVIVVDAQNRVQYVQLVDEITHEPDYQAAINAL